MYLFYVDIDECVSSFCFNGGICIDVINDFRCVCVVLLIGMCCEFGFGKFLFILRVCIVVRYLDVWVVVIIWIDGRKLKDIWI